jgi:hypothetical protein
MTPNTAFRVPPGAVSEVHILDTGVRMVNLRLEFLLAPKTDGFERFPPLPAWSFLIQSSKGEKVLFDLSIPPDNATYPPAALELHKEAEVKIDGTKNVADILRGQGVNLSEISSVIWRYVPQPACTDCKTNECAQSPSLGSYWRHDDTPQNDGTSRGARL